MNHFCPADSLLTLAHEYHEDYSDHIKARDSDLLLEVLSEHKDSLQDMVYKSSISDEPTDEEHLNLCFYKLKLLSEVLT